MFARIGGERQDRLIEAQAQEVRDIYTFPDENPYPLLRVTRDGAIAYANAPGRTLLKRWIKDVGDLLPSVFLTALDKINEQNPTENIELIEGDRVYLFTLTYVAGREYVNIYSSDISHRKRMEIDLIEARDMAEKASSAKSEFLARMSHELRTPMNSILGFTQLLKMNGDSRLTQSEKDNLEVVLSAGNHLLDLINEILDLARIESGHMEIHLDAVDLLAVVADVISLSQPLARPNRIDIRCETSPGSTCLVEADRLRLKQVLVNLVSNAIKYNHPEGTVVISLASSGPKGKARLQVRDTGPGIPEDQQHRLFTAFDRLEIDPSLVEGTGIGLALCKQLIEAMGGTIGYTPAPGGGSVFYIEIPLARIGEGPAVSGNGNAPEAADGRRKILYIEDIPANVMLVRQILECRPNCEVIPASNASQGIELAGTCRPDLILMDINLPDMDGRDAFLKLQAIEATRHIPVVALTAEAMKGDDRLALEMGFTSYITKPIDVNQFLNAIDEVLV